MRDSDSLELGVRGRTPFRSRFVLTPLLASDRPYALVEAGRVSARCTVLPTSA